MLFWKRALILLVLILLLISSVQAAWYSGSWSNREKITVPASNVSSDLTNFPVFVDMSNLPSGFFSIVRSDGGDIRVTKADGTTELAREVVFIDTANSEGEMHFLASGTLSSSTNTDFYIYYGNAAATEPAETDTYGAQNTWVQDFVGVWHLDESVGSATNVYDSTSYNNDGTTDGAMVSNDSVAAVVGRGIDFDGTSDSIAIPHSASLNFERTDSFTISSYVKVVGASLDQVNSIFSKMDSGSPYRGYDLQARNDISSVSAEIFSTWTSSSLYKEAPYSPSTVKDTWSYLAFAYGGTSTSSALDIYVNENRKNPAATYDSLTTTIQNTNTARIGSRDTVSNVWQDYFEGVIDEVRVSSVKRSEAWSNAEYINFSAPTSFCVINATETPSLTESYPNDNQVNILPKTFLRLQFNTSVTVNTGNVTIYKTSDDSLVDTIDVTSGRVYGVGADEIYIYPLNGLVYATDYYILIDADSFDNGSIDPYPGISSKTELNFSTKDQEFTPLFDDCCR